MVTHARISATATAEQSFITPFELKALFGGRSDMWLWRHKSDLPKPIYFAGRRYYSKSEVEACRQRLLDGRDNPPMITPVRERGRTKAAPVKKRGRTKAAPVAVKAKSKKLQLKK